MFEFAHPYLLALLPLAWCLRRWLPPAGTLGHAALWAPFYQRLQRLSGQPAPRFARPRWKLVLAYSIWCLLCLAAAGPQWLGEAVKLPQAGRNLMLAVDISGSMQIKDMVLNGKSVDRLTDVKAIATAFIEARQGDRLGLVLFGSRAYLQTPLTFDLSTVAQQLDDATIGLAGQETAIGDAIALGVKHLLDASEKNRVLILLTDGVNTAGTIDPMKAAELAVQTHVKIYTIGMGATALTVPGMFGPRQVNPSAQLDVKTLTKIAELTQGRFFRAENTEALAAAYRELDRLEPTMGQAAFYRPLTPLYPWPLGMAFLLSLIVLISASTSRWRGGR